MEPDAGDKRPANALVAKLFSGFRFDSAFLCEDMDLWVDIGDARIDGIEMDCLRCSLLISMRRRRGSSSKSAGLTMF